MSTLAEALASNAADLIDDKAEDWIDGALDKGVLLSKELPESEQGQADQVIAVLRAGKTPLARLGSLGFAKLTSYLLEDGDEEKARLYYLEHEATFSERRAAMHAATSALIAEGDADKAAWDAAKAVLKQAAGLALPFLLKIAASSVGIPL